MCHSWTADAAVASLACGLAIDTLLMLNNYRDREQDALSGKRTLVVRFGARVGRILYLATGSAAVLLCLWFVPRGRLWAGLLPLLYLPFHAASWRRMTRIGSGKALNGVLGETSRNMLLWAALLSLGLILG